MNHLRTLVLTLLTLISVPVFANTAITLPDLNPSEWFDGKMGGTFGAKTVTAKKWSKVAETTNDAYSAAAKAVLTQATGAFAKLFAENPAK